MDIRPMMQAFGFGHRASGQIIIDHEGELWLAAAPVVAGGFLPAGGGGLPGGLRIEPTENGAVVPFTYTATEGLLELTTQKGAKLRFAIDADAQALRIRGNTALRLNGIKDGPGTQSLNTPAGVSLRVGGGSYLFTAKQGAITFDDSWLLHKRHSVAPVLDIEPEGGEIELYAYDLPADTAAPAITKTLDQCAAESCAAFAAFVDTLVDIPDEWRDVKEKIAYLIWLCHRTLDGKNEVIVENKYNSRDTNARLMAIASLVFKDAAKAVDMILAYPADLPPVAGLAAARLLEDEKLNDARGEIYRIFASLEAVARKCIQKRTVDKDGLSFYAYRFESGMGRSPAFFQVGEPVLAPDLNAYLVLVSEVLGKLAGMEYDVGAGRTWEARAKALQAKLVAELWDGEDFVGKHAYTGELSGPDRLLSLVPAILGSRLPDEIVRKLAAKAAAEAPGGAVGYLVVGGLYDAGEKALAKDITLRVLAEARIDGVDCPFCGASLLALAHKVL